MNINEHGENSEIVIETFKSRGIPENEIKPKVNVLTFPMWKKNKRVVKQGERGIKISFLVPFNPKKYNQHGRELLMMKIKTVFHISQTIELREVS